MFRRSVLLTLLVAVANCGGGGGNTGDDDGGVADDDGPPPPDARPPPSCDQGPSFCTPASGSNLTLTLVTDQVTDPIVMTAPECDTRLFIVERTTGRIRIVVGGNTLPTPFLQIDVNGVEEEEGFLGLAFHPNYAQNGRFFVLYTKPNDPDLRIAEYHADPSSDVADTTETVIMDIDHPYANGNGGTLAFGPDGYLYISLGDGGGNNDIADSGQNPDVPMGKILRIDVDGAAPYAIPPTNPWADGTDGVPEMYAWGLRNPWRIAIDPVTGDVWLGDVGERQWEEYDVIRAASPGGNYGWPVFLGPACFTDDAAGNAGCTMPENYVMPVTAYDRSANDTGCAAIGGLVYRGPCMPDLQGRYFFGDYCLGTVHSIDSTLDTVDIADATDHSSDLDPSMILYGKLASFGTDGYGEMYVTAYDDGDVDAVYRISLE